MCWSVLLYWVYLATVLTLIQGIPIGRGEEDWEWHIFAELCYNPWIALRTVIDSPEKAQVHLSDCESLAVAHAPCEVTKQNVEFANGTRVNIPEHTATASECKVKRIVNREASAALTHLRLLASLQPQFWMPSASLLRFVYHMHGTQCQPTPPGLRVEAVVHCEESRAFCSYVVQVERTEPSRFPTGAPQSMSELTQS